MSDQSPASATKRKRRGRRPARAPSDLRKIFGDNLRSVRYAKELSIFDIALSADVEWSYVAQVERGERSVGLDVMDALAQAVGVPLFELLNPDSGDLFRKLIEK